MSYLEKKQKTASQAYLEVAVAHGVDYVFGLPGTSGQEFIGTDLNFAKMADCFGILGQRVERPDEIEPALKRAMEQSGPAIVDVVISQKSRKD